MQRRIDSKYEIVLDTGCEAKAEDYIERIVIRNSLNGNEIPEDEPIFIFRARDILAFPALVHYFELCQKSECTKEQLASLHGMITEFAKWMGKNKDKMKQPGSTMPDDMKKLKGEAIDRHAG